MKEIFKTLITEFFERNLEQVKDRELQVPADSSKIISIIGARRTGKTFFLFSIIKKLRDKLQSNRLVYINFEDDRLFPLKVNDLKYLIDAYYELYPENRNGFVYFFFDEIQVVKNWELFVRRIYDTEKCRIFITGSSSKLLSKEIATALRGRTFSYELFPLSFREYLEFKNIEIDFYSPGKKAYIINAFNRYISTTSFPELIGFDDPELKLSLQGYIDMIIYKDLVERYNITNIPLIKHLIKFLYLNISNPVSANKIFNDLKSQNISLSKDTLHEYIAHLEDAFVIFFVPVFTNNLREMNRNPRKIYSLDIGLNTSLTNYLNIGRIFENIAYLHLRRKYDTLYYSKIAREVDFIIARKDVLQAVNVSYSIDDAKTRKREIEALHEIMDIYDLQKGLIITSEDEGRINKNKKTIYIKPLWKWLLEKQT